MESESKKFCIKCGKEIPSTSEFCPFCGASQKEEIKTSLQEKETVETKKDVSTKPIKQPKKWYKRWWVIAIIAVVLIFIISGMFSGSGSDPDDVAADIESRLKSDNTLDIVSVKADEDSGTIIVKAKENKAISNLYLGYTSQFKTVQRSFLELSKKYQDEETEDFDFSYIQLMKPGTNDKILLSVDKGKIKYSSLDDVN